MRPPRPNCSVGRAPSGPGRALVVGMQGWVGTVLTRGAPWLEEKEAVGVILGSSFKVCHGADGGSREAGPWWPWGTLPVSWEGSLLGCRGRTTHRGPMPATDEGGGLGLPGAQLCTLGLIASRDCTCFPLAVPLEVLTFST